MNRSRKLRSVPRLLVPSVTALAAALLLAACEVNVEPGPNGPTGTVTGRVTTINGNIPTVPPGAPGSPPVPMVAGAALQPLEAGQPFVPDQLLVTFEPQLASLSLQAQETQVLQLLDSNLQPQLLTAGNENVPALFELAPGTDVLAAAAELEGQPGVAAVQPNYIYRLLALPDDPDLKEQWPLPLAGVPLAWEERTDAADLVIAVLDTGFDLEHPDLERVFIRDGYDFCGTAGCADEDPNARPDSDNNPHGTHVAGILAAAGNNGQGISGVIGSGSNFILPVKVFHGGATTSEAVIRALNWSAGLPVPNVSRNMNPANIINLSFGAETNDPAFHSAISGIAARGVLLVAASGNDGRAKVLYPAAYPEVLAVGSANTVGQRSCFSNYGPELDLLAPGGEATHGTLANGEFGAFPNCPNAEARDDLGVFSTIPRDDYGWQAGTSMAAPVVSGIAALVWADLGSDASADAVRQQLIDTAYGGGGRTGPEYGHGLVRADVALGFAGPGDPVTISSASTSAAGQAILDLSGGSSDYQLTLPAGLQTLDARARRLTGSMQVDVKANRTTEVRPLRIAP
jgi:serine protease